jgi:hypothetical protein
MQRIGKIPHRDGYWGGGGDGGYIASRSSILSLSFLILIPRANLTGNRLLHSFNVFLSMPPHVPYGLRGLLSRLWPKCNRHLRLGRPWGAVTLTRWGGWWYMNIKYQEAPWTQVLLNHPDHGHHGNLPLQGKVPMVEPGIEPGISWSVVRNSDH